MFRAVKAVGLMVTVGAALAMGGGVASADAGAQGAAVGSPGVLSGNVVQIPVHVPVNVCGNTVGAIGLLSPAFGNTCVNDSRGGWQEHGWHGSGMQGHMGMHGQPMDHQDGYGQGR
ncbi:chaplin [Streptomyces xanthochromogenes]|uniref:chaplin n=1 Tax=Streptomyces xanthochromogenes TaxID=67384 RepID=UPI003F4E370C